MRRSGAPAESARAGVSGRRLAMAGVLLGLLSIGLALYSLFVGPYAGASDSLVVLPYRSMFAEALRVPISELAPREWPDSATLALFALDISAPPNMHQLSSDQKLAFQDGLMEVRDELVVTHTRWDHLEENYINLAKVRLCQLLIDLSVLREGEQRSYSFAIWTVGHSAVDFLGGTPDVSGEAVREAICKLLDNLTQPTDGTNLAQKFRGVLRHLNSYECRQWRYSRGDFLDLMITMPTDTDYHDRDQEVQQALWELERLVPELPFARVQINLILLSTSRYPEPDVYESVVAVFDRSAGPSGLNTAFVGEVKLGEVLHPIIWHRRGVEFYYTDPADIDTTSFSLVVDRACAVVLDMPVEVGLESPSGIGIYCEPITSQGHPLEEGRLGRRLAPGRRSVAVGLEPGHRIRLTYSGALPAASDLPILRLSLEGSHATFLLPIRFVRRLPGWASVFAIVLQAFILCCVVLIPLTLIRGRWQDFGERQVKEQTPAAVGEAGEDTEPRQGVGEPDSPDE